MNNILLHYHRVDSTTWAYLSSLLMIALFFKFNRVWSVRNVDLVLLILLAPGLLLVDFSQQQQRQIRLHATALGPSPASNGAPRPRARSATMSERGVEPNATDESVGTGDAETKPAGAEDARDLTLTHLATSHQEWRQVEQRGFFWLFAVGVIFLVRLLFDSTMVRRRCWSRTCRLAA